MAQRTKIYTVSQVNLLIRQVLEDSLPQRLTVSGEITDWKLHQSGHCYFSLKDENSQLPCVMWRGLFSRLRFQPENGLAVLATGYVDVYAPQGRYQFYVESMVPAGVGALQLAFEQMVRRLEAEGLFEAAHKKTLPLYPQRIGILTSESGAAVHDVTDSIRNRWPCARLFLYPVPVQGEGAAEKIAAAIADVNRRNRKLKLDVIIVGRGGGSLEDLWAFNEEVVARAIYDSKIPIISAVGHEIDTTIADLVADARASTPTRAGVVAVPDAREVLESLAATERRLAGQLRAVVQLASERLRTVLAGDLFKRPQTLVRNREQYLDELQVRLGGSLRELLTTIKEKLAACYEQVVKLEPHRMLGKKMVDLNDLQNRVLAAVRQTINKYAMQLVAQDNRLAALNPKSVLQRGYSITTRKKTALVVRASADVEIDDLLVTELAEQNLIESRVTKK